MAFPHSVRSAWFGRVARLFCPVPLPTATGLRWSLGGRQGADLFADRAVETDPGVALGEGEERRRTVDHRQSAFLDRAVEPDAAQPTDGNPLRQHRVARVAQQQEMSLGRHLRRLLYPVQEIAVPVSLQIAPLA